MCVCVCVCVHACACAYCVYERAVCVLVQKGYIYICGVRINFMYVHTSSIGAEGNVCYLHIDYSDTHIHPTAT